jgi:alpha-beta hydrolase superfamily lysophospholipase
MCHSIIRRDIGDLPLFLVGVSLSGQIALHVLESPLCRSLELRGVVILAGMLIEVQKRSYKAYVRAISAVAKLFPNLPVVGYNTSDSPKWQTDIGEHDPYLYTGPFLSGAIGACFDATQRGRQLVSNIVGSGVPDILFLHNENDPICPYVGVLDIHSRMIETVKQKAASGVPVPTVQSKIYNASEETVRDWQYWGVVADPTKLQIEHTIANDLDGAYVFSDLLKWLNLCMITGPHVESREGIVSAVLRSGKSPVACENLDSGKSIESTTS